MIHLLKLRQGAEITGKCGVTGKAVNGRQPPEFTAWGSETTCMSCLPVASQSVSVVVEDDPPPLSYAFDL